MGPWLTQVPLTHIVPLNMNCQKTFQKQKFCSTKKSSINIIFRLWKTVLFVKVASISMSFSKPKNRVNGGPAVFSLFTTTVRINHDSVYTQKIVIL